MEDYNFSLKKRSWELLTEKKKVVTVVKLTQTYSKREVEEEILGKDSC